MDIVISIAGKEMEGISSITYETEEVVMNITMMGIDNSIVNVDLSCSPEQIIGILETLSRSYSVSVKVGSDEISLANFIASMRESKN